MDVREDKVIQFRAPSHSYAQSLDIDKPHRTVSPSDGEAWMGEEEAVLGEGFDITPISTSDASQKTLTSGPLGVAWRWWGVAMSLLAMGGVLGLGISRFHSSPGQNAAGANTLYADTGFNPVTNDIVVYVKGDVRHPGVVKVSASARVKEVVEAAGGFVHPEDSTGVNLAAPVDDGAEIVIPDMTKTAPPNLAVPSTSLPSPHLSRSSGENVTQAPGALVSTETAGMKIDLNTADAQTLETIPGIGPAKANAIMTYRQKHGRFSSVAELQNVNGIGEVTYARIAPYVVVLTSPVQ